MRILLTGASGFIGKHLQAALLAGGHDVLSAQRSPPGNTNARLTYLHADFTKDTDKSDWLARLHGVDVVINAVGIFREQGRQTFAALHTDAPCALFAACAETPGVQLVLQISALGADGQANTRYHLSKKAADDYLASLPLRACILQPSLVYGKDGVSARVFKMLASMPFCVRFGSAPQLVQPIHVDDLVAAVIALLRVAPDSTRIALVGPAPLPFTGYLALLRRAMGMGKLRVLQLPRALAYAVASLGIGLLERDALRMLERGNSADPSITTSLLGYAPRAPDTFIEDPAAERLQASWAGCCRCCGCRLRWSGLQPPLCRPASTRPN